MNKKAPTNVREIVARWCLYQRGILRQSALIDAEVVALWVEDRTRDVSEAAAWPNSASGLDRLAPVEMALGLTSSGSETHRLDSVAAEIARKVSAWEQMRPKELLSERNAIGAVHNVLECMFFDGEPAPGDWWEYLIYRIGESAFVRCYAQVARCHKAVMAREYGREERAAGGNIKQARDPKQVAKVEARKLWNERHAGKHPTLRTNQQFAMECMRRWPVLTSAAVIAGWCTAWNKASKARKPQPAS